ncbi:DUF1513 domain-containing protein [Ruegeria pomeroyi]|uniref:Twin-arginine translocation pathway signal n=2 Tax=Ruegeria pomeroyi TaxID=89184 RepID=Q5LWN9_RUEPO|nr:DUF1513 domain-containing protein [Ruegeria pomeroyi]AAV93421.1 hypothetical protein SPO0090 [Ruegeria pomeroyi DSS-3]NVK99050.1 DUF1513 domain-containing protein [Ruegeria pomeroyi]NVL00740.1 DUF1513 domain-containing protein [Ruegeria pomeroyi]QWV10716.1 DUF1513 domain-containing protein [Ruegeria pomeroyi]
MTTRRGFLAGLAAAGLTPRAGWADAGAPAFLSAGRVADGAYNLYGLDRRGRPLFHLPIPDRGHAAAAHPQRAEAVAFARRPGRFALVLNCVSGAEIARLSAPEGRHFYGHGAFDAEGRVLFTTENDYEAGQGRIGLWDAGAGYRRIGEVASGGVGPHDIRLMPDGQTLVVANGGVETHPDTGRVKLNLPVMQPNLSYLSLAGEVLEVVRMPPEHRMNSIRHLDLRADGLVAFAMQWQGEGTELRPVLGLHRRGTAPVAVTGNEAEMRAMNGYGGSVIFYDQGRRVAVSSPRGGIVQLSDVAAGRIIGGVAITDVCGLGVTGGGLVASSGSGVFTRVGGKEASRSEIAWDNHLVAVNRA